MKCMVKMKRPFYFYFKNEGIFWLTQYMYMWIHMCVYVFAFLTKMQSLEGTDCDLILSMLLEMC